MKIISSRGRVISYIKLLKTLPFNFFMARLNYGLVNKYKKVDAEHIDLDNVGAVNLEPAISIDKAQLIEKVDPDLKEFLKKSEQYVAEHRFDLLGSGLKEVIVEDETNASQVKAKMAKYLAESELIKSDAFINYKPLDWHLDFKSGYRWDSEASYKDIRISPGPGVDIKVPWELSRFQHLPQIGLLANLEDNKKWSQEFMLQVADWIAANPYLNGVNWRCSMDVAIRAVNWLWAWVLFIEVSNYSSDFKVLLTRSLYQHASHIENNLEYIKRGYNSNHYLANITGLIYIGAMLPDLPESDRWLAFGLQELIEEMKCQVYDDGVSYEDSTAYHRLVAEMFYSCTALVLNLPADRRKRLVDYDCKEHKVKPVLKPYSKQEYDLLSDQIFPGWYYKKLELMAEYVLDITKMNKVVPQFGDNDSGRLHKFTPAINEEGEEEANDHRHILALAGKLFGRDDFLREGKEYELDAELLLGKVKTLPVDSGVKRNAAFKRALIISRKDKNFSAKIASEIIISLEEVTSAADSNDMPVNYYYPDGGIAVYKNDLYCFAITCGPNGMSGVGAHSHNDKLSFELNIAGLDFIVDGGSYLYTPDPEQRNAFRSTWAHNTVAVKGKEQNEIIKEFLFILPEHSKAGFEKVTGTKVTGSHRGYGFKHAREVLFSQKQIIIKDYLERSVEAYFILNLHPGVEVKGGEDNEVFLSNKGIKVKVSGANVGQYKETPGFYSTGYGKRIENKRLLIPLGQ